MCAARCCHIIPSSPAEDVDSAAVSLSRDRSCSAQVEEAVKEEEKGKGGRNGWEPPADVLGEQYLVFHCKLLNAHQRWRAQSWW